MDLGEAQEQQGNQQVFQQYRDAEISSPQPGSSDAASWEEVIERPGPETLIARPRGPRQTIRSSLSAPIPPPGMLANSKGSASQRCVAYCTAEQFDWDGLLKVLQKSMVPSIYFSEVIHVNLQESKEASEGDVFFFKDGSLVFWAIPYDQATKILDLIEPYQIGAYHREDILDCYSEVIDFTYGKQAGLLPSGELILSVGQNNWAKAQILEKIAFSHGLQRSVKVSVIERISEDLIKSLKHIPDILMEKRALKLDKTAVMKIMGQLLSLRGLINLHLPLSETPEAYWEEPWLEDLYSKISRELDLTGRIRTLNRKLDYAHQVVEVLRTELSERHSTRLEKIIIFLISIEVAFEMFHFFA
ncbi:hypothetical protein GUITHDRAFT_120340 [Guillardia theta CCMP2712]|uniref:DUF155 domain-containing protein n=2 Tax=Guillardia theta TaxID=55529 RepID=L1ICC4_GUITC|nr:hypothetical protein GUITHDRAFT_120340 [Guillardia theta CCMP2712]EKX33490.1 hypothetical protein GUITHDRAFT_120340 [Guillardia theta CCMP2712]|eukprot:XP_005820470.1 hypothetical protein GUITHDRAFT_120340 [Guillardia theta CCMP2712]